MSETDYEKMAERHTKALGESMKQTIAEHMTLAWYDPTNCHVSADKNDPLFTPLGQLWPLDAARKWVGLTDEEIHNTEGYKETREMYDFARLIEAKLKDKNT